jgi:hypothetical protein
MRQWIAIAICLTSAALGVIALSHGSRIPLTVALIASVWHFTADWLGNRLWLLRKSLGGIQQEAMRGNLKLPPVARAISWCSTILLICAGISLFV